MTPNSESCYGTMNSRASSLLASGLTVLGVREPSPPVRLGGDAIVRQPSSAQNFVKVAGHTRFCRHVHMTAPEWEIDRSQGIEHRVGVTGPRAPVAVEPMHVEA